MSGILAFLWTAALLSLCGCVCFAWKLRATRRGASRTATVVRILREAPTCRPVGWRCRAVVRVPFQGREIEQTLTFWTRRRATDSQTQRNGIPVLIRTDRQGKPRVLVQDSKGLLLFLAVACGVFALLFGLVILLAAAYGTRAPVM